MSHWSLSTREVAELVYKAAAEVAEKTGDFWPPWSAINQSPWILASEYVTNAMNDAYDAELEVQLSLRTPRLCEYCVIK